MLREYALDPGLLTSWERVRYYCEKFGYDQGRLIARFPKTWKRMVWESVSATRPIEKQRITEFLNRLDGRMRHRTRPYDGAMEWLQNAERAHAKVPFAAIITQENPRRHEFVVTNDEFEDEHRLIGVARPARVERDPRRLAEFLAPMFEDAKLVRFVDAYFDPQPSVHAGSPKYRLTRQLLPLVAFMLRIDPSCRIEYHALRQTNRGRRIPIGDEDQKDRQSWETACCTCLPYVLPKGREVTVHRWQEVDGGLQFHARYVLTDRCGVMIDPGLDADHSTAGEMADITLMSESARQQVIQLFEASSTPYTLLSQHPVVGTMEFLPQSLSEK